MTPNPNILDFEDALAVVRAEAARVPAPAATQSLPLLDARNRVLAEPVLADRDQPPFNRSARDGFAVRAADLSAGIELTLLGEVRAGSRWPGKPLEQGQAIQIMTGAPVPAGADAVLMVEHALRQAATINAQPGRVLTPGENIVPQGSEARLGATVLTAQTVLGPAELALAASCGRAHLPVYKRPRVAILATGDELVELDQTPAPEQIRNSNSYALAALVTAAGGEPDRLPIVADEREATAALLARARTADLIVLSGGVSMGEYDLVEETLLAAGAHFLFTGVRMQPGRPAVFGYLPPLTAGGRPTYFFGLPGNPISVQVTFQCFAAPLLRALAGELDPAPRWALATLAEAVAARPGLTRLLPARVSGTAVTVIPWQGSGDLTANARAHCYAELLPGRAYIASDVLRVLLR